MKNVAVGIISRADDQGVEEYLLVRSRKDFGRYTDFYYPPGGHVEEGETEIDALIREIREELGLAVIPVRKIAETEGDIEDQRTHWWLCEASPVELTIHKKEIADAGYFTREQMMKMNIWPATKNLFEKYIYNN